MQEMCGPCKMMVPHFQTMVLAFPKIKFAKFNCKKPENEEVARRYRVRAMPTFNLYGANGEQGCGG